MSSSNLKLSNITKSFNPSNIAHAESYNSLLNLRTTLLHMQYLYASLSQKLERQHINQENQHKDHLIQCHNMRQEIQELKSKNFTKLFIVKLQELLAIEENMNIDLTIQPQGPSSFPIKPNFRDKSLQIMDSSAKDQINQAFISKQQLEFIPKIQKLLTLVKIKQQEMQHSLCKLYIGNKVLLDLPKTASSIQQIESKIDDFMAKHKETLALYNRKIKELQQTKTGYANYLASVDKKIKGLTEMQKKHQKQTKTPNGSESINSQNRSYQNHIRSRLFGEEKSIQNRLNDLKQKLLINS